jgi:NTP pyrophosphatase (non-canonical NTP hydrolase)
MEQGEYNFKLNQLSNRIYRNNKEKGFWDSQRNVGELLMLVTSELGEAMEAHRKVKHADWKGFMHDLSIGDKDFTESFRDNIKDTFEDEIADSIIRLLDLCGGLKIDIDRHIEGKLTFNQTRPRLHGKSY